MKSIFGMLRTSFCLSPGGRGREFGFAFLLMLLQCGLQFTGVSQEVPAAEDTLPTYTMEAKVVTADRYVNRLASSTSALSLLNAEEIRQGPWTKFTDLLGAVPGFFMFNRDGVGRDAIVSTRGFYGAGEAEYIQVLLDGKQINDLETGLVNWNLVPLNSISSVEIARGASSSAYGDAAMGGVINIITRNDAYARRSLTLTGGMLGSFDAELRSQGTLADLPYQLYLSNEGTNGFRDHSHWRGVTLGGDIVFRDGGPGAVRLSTLNQWSKSDDPGPLTDGAVATNREWSSAYYKSDGRNDRRYQAQLDYTYKVSTASDLQANMFFKYKSSDVIRTFPNPPVIIDPADGSFIGVYDTTAYGDTKERDIPTTEYGLSLQYNLSHPMASMRNRLSLGFDGVYGSLRSTYYSQFLGFEHDYSVSDFSRGTVLSDGNGRRVKLALFLNDELQLLEPLKLILGLRYDVLGDQYEGKSTDMTISVNNSLLSPKIGVNFQYLNIQDYSGNMYAAVNSSFKAPTLDQISDQRPVDAGFFVPTGQNSYFFSPVTLVPFSNALLKPQRAASYEIGVYQHCKLLPGIYAEMTMSLYRMDITDEIDFDLQAFRYANIQESRHDGTEIGFRFYRLPDVTAFINFTWTRVTFRSGSRIGNELKAIPKTVTSVGALYRHPVGLSFSIAWNFVNEIYLDDENTARLPNYHHGSAKLSFSASPVTVFIDVDNLANQRFSSTGFLLFGETFLYPSAGRTIQGGVALEF